MGALSQADARLAYLDTSALIGADSLLTDDTDLGRVTSVRVVVIGEHLSQPNL